MPLGAAKAALLGAAGSAGGDIGYEAIDTTTSTSGVTTISFTSIPDTYTILKIVYVGSRVTADSQTQVNLGTGGGSPDTTDSNYGSQTYLIHNWGSLNAASLTKTTSAWRKYPGEVWPNYTATDYPSVGMYTFAGYSSTVANKSSWFMGSSRDTQTASGGGSADGGPLRAYYYWDNAGAIDRIDLYSVDHDFDDFTCTLFGLAG